MKVKDLLQKLQNYNQELPVVVCGLDRSGFMDICTIKEITIVQRETCWCDYDYPQNSKVKNTFNALYIDYIDY